MKTEIIFWIVQMVINIFACYLLILHARSWRVQNKLNKIMSQIVERTFFYNLQTERRLLNLEGKRAKNQKKKPKRKK